MKANSYKYRGYYCINSNTRNIDPLLSNNLKKLCSDLYQICKDYKSANYYWYIVDNEGNKTTDGQQVNNTYHRLTKNELIVF
jgi:hypothetical protein